MFGLEDTVQIYRSMDFSHALKQQAGDYQKFIASKVRRHVAVGFDVDAKDINAQLYPFQRDIVRWSLRLGKSAIFAAVGLGKTFMQIEWARHVASHTGKPVLILAPLAVSHQTVREGKKFGIEVTYRKDGKNIAPEAIVITNYERLDKFDARQFGGVVLDESSILKNFTGKTKRALIATFVDTPYKLTCSATPAPNDHMELGNHADFLDIMPSNEMISRWFINDTMSAGSYRLKHHAQDDFWRWLTSWAVCITKPGDLGDEYDMPEFELPKLNIIGHFVRADNEAYENARQNGRLIPTTAPSSTRLGKAKRLSMASRLDEIKSLMAQIPENEPVLIWCNLNDEADALQEAFPDATEVRGSDKADDKERKLLDFSDGNTRVLITKASIAGHGMNWQHCNHMIYFGLDYSFEAFYQSKGRTHRYGQKREVQCHVIYAETEGNVIDTLNRKQEQFETMQREMAAAMRKYGLFRDDVRLTLTSPVNDIAKGKNWTLYLGDCVERIKEIPDNSIDLGIHSPPFSNLYIYSDSEADMGNSSDDDEFFAHYRFLIKELYRTTAPGRLCVVHCKDLPCYMNRDGAAGLKDFPGEIIRAFEAEGWQYHSRVTIWKDPVIEMQRTKNHGLLHKNFEKETNACRQGMPDYLVVFRKWPLDGQVKVTQHREPGDYIGTNEPQPAEYEIHKGKKVRSPRRNYSIHVWQRYASPVWFDIDQTNVLNYRVAKTNEDEKHIAPLQLDVIARCVDLWSNPGDAVFSPFAGIGSEGYEAIKLGRKFIGIELKREYFDYAAKYLSEAELEKSQPTLFDLLESDA